MPNPKQFKDQKNFMQQCMHTTLHREHKSPEQGQAQCLNQWRDRGKKKKKGDLNPVSDMIRDLVSEE
jgi:hypothetical protein